MLFNIQQNILLDFFFCVRVQFAIKILDTCASACRLHQSFNGFKSGKKSDCWSVTVGKKIPKQSLIFPGRKQWFPNRTVKSLSSVYICAGSRGKRWQSCSVIGVSASQGSCTISGGLCTMSPTCPAVLRPRLPHAGHLLWSVSHYFTRRLVLMKWQECSVWDALGFLTCPSSLRRKSRAETCMRKPLCVWGTWYWLRPVCDFDKCGFGDGERH